MAEKGREYRTSILDKKLSLVLRVIRKSSEINDLLYSYQNSTTVKEELAQLNNIYNLIVEINDEMTETDVNYSVERWFAEINEKVFSFKHKLYNWLREGENDAKRGKVSKSSGSKIFWLKQVIRIQIIKDVIQRESYARKAESS